MSRIFYRKVVQGKKSTCAMRPPSLNMIRPGPDIDTKGRKRTPKCTGALRDNVNNVTIFAPAASKGALLATDQSRAEFERVRY